MQEKLENEYFKKMLKNMDKLLLLGSFHYFSDIVLCWRLSGDIEVTQVSNSVL